MLVANRFTLAGLAFVALSMLGSLLLVTDLMFDGAAVIVTIAVATIVCVAGWCVLPAVRRSGSPAGGLEHCADERLRPFLRAVSVSR